MSTELVKKGRKRITFTEEQLKEAGRLAGLGFSEKSICEVALGCSVSTLQRNKKRSANFDQYIRQGKMKAIEEVSSALFDSATGRNGKEPSVSAQIFFLKNKGKQADNPWADVQKVDYDVNLNDIIRDRKVLIDKGQVRDRTEQEPKKALTTAYKEVGPVVLNQKTQKNKDLSVAPSSKPSNNEQLEGED